MAVNPVLLPALKLGHKGVGLVLPLLHSGVSSNLTAPCISIRLHLLQAPSSFQTRFLPKFASRGRWSIYSVGFSLELGTL